MHRAVEENRGTESRKWCRIAGKGARKKLDRELAVLGEDPGRQLSGVVWFICASAMGRASTRIQNVERDSAKRDNDEERTAREVEMTSTGLRPT
jgi:hypothetical protein